MAGKNFTFILKIHTTKTMWVILLISQILKMLLKPTNQHISEVEAMLSEAEDSKS